MGLTVGTFFGMSRVMGLTVGSFFGMYRAMGLTVGAFLGMSRAIGLVVGAFFGMSRAMVSAGGVDPERSKLQNNMFGASMAPKPKKTTPMVLPNYHFPDLAPKSFIQKGNT